MIPDRFDDVDIDLLADYIGGALDGPDETAVARLIAEDPRWRETYDLLAPGMIEVGARLQALGARPEPMPADVVTRLAAALASSISDRTVTDPAVDTPAGPYLVGHGQPDRDGQPGPAPDLGGPSHLHVVPGPGSGRPARRRGRRLRWAAPIAVAAGVLAFAGLGIEQLSDPSEDTASTAGSASEAMPALSLVAAPPDDRIVTSGADYTAPTLGTDPTGTMAATEVEPRQSRTGASAAAREFSTDPLARLRPRDALLACLEDIAREHGGALIDVRSVDYARFDGTPALIVQFVSGGVTWGWAAGPDCGAPGRGAGSLQTRRVG